MADSGGWCIWVTGLPGSGKSTITIKLLEKLESLKVHVQIVSSDMLKRVMTPKPSYTEEERDIQSLRYNAFSTSYNFKLEVKSSGRNR